MIDVIRTWSKMFISDNKNLLFWNARKLPSGVRYKPKSFVFYFPYIVFTRTKHVHVEKQSHCYMRKKLGIS